MIVLNIKPLGSDRFAGFVGKRCVVRSSRTPFLDAARALIVRGTRPDAMMVMVHPNGTRSLTSTLAAAARLGVRDNGAGMPRFRLWKPNALAEAAE